MNSYAQRLTAFSAALDKPRRFVPIEPELEMAPPKKVYNIYKVILGTEYERLVMMGIPTLDEANKALTCCKNEQGIDDVGDMVIKSWQIREVLL